jgi:hypothetical protein
LASQVIQRCCHIQEQISRPNIQNIPDLTPEERHDLKWSIGESIGTVYTDLIIPLISAYPELDPDQEDGPPPPRPRAETPETPTLQAFGTMLVEASVDAKTGLRELIEIVEQASQDEGRVFRAEAAKSAQHVDAVGALGQRILARAR